jgi:hypothetical protein
MPLRKSPRPTPKLLAAKRQNARLSTGPRTAAGKQKSKMNALKHGLYAARENHQQTMLALGEDPHELRKTDERTANVIENKGAILPAANEPISNGKWQMAKFKWFYICHWLFAICLLKLLDEGLRVRRSDKVGVSTMTGNFRSTFRVYVPRAKRLVS